MQNHYDTTEAPLSERICTQPQCMFRDKEIDCEFLANVLVRLAAGEDVSDFAPAAREIIPDQRCTCCALRVMADRKPLPTVEELEGLVEAGRWTYRRHRRQRRREVS